MGSFSKFNSFYSANRQDCSRKPGIQALEDAGLSGGFMAWNAMCSLSKLEDL